MVDRARVFTLHAMRYHRLDLNLLPALRALLTEKNVTRAGDSLHVTQSAMSGILARLREFFDDPLIVSVGRKMELTPLAESLVDKVNDLLVQVDSTLASRPDFLPANSQRHFSIVSSDYTVSVLLLDVLRRLHVEAPNVTIAIRQPGDATLPDLEAGDLDFHISPMGQLSDNHPSAVLFEDSFCAVVDRGNDRVGDSLTVEQYLSLSHVGFEYKGLPMFDRWFARMHSDRRRDVSVGQFNLLAPMVVGTQRVATLHTRLAMRACELLPVRMVQLEFETPRFANLIQWHRYRDLDPGSIWLRDKIIACALAMPPLPRP
ncbi:LysR substrate-binding domain-containing protein [Oxalobacteraceae bacterium OTU3CAMAD1]|nr:LysR substrate-binding domain-containing protein [Oxalobacteraceae bacterium OTU3CAMAD1]